MCDGLSLLHHSHALIARAVLFILVQTGNAQRARVLGRNRGTHLRQDESIEVAARVIGMRSTAARTRIATAGRLGTRTTSQDEHVGAGGVLRKLSKYDLTEWVHARCRNAEELNAGVIGLLHGFDVSLVIGIIEVRRGIANEKDETRNGFGAELQGAHCHAKRFIDMLGSVATSIGVESRNTSLQTGNVRRHLMHARDECIAAVFVFDKSHSRTNADRAKSACYFFERITQGIDFLRHRAGRIENEGDVDGLCVGENSIRRQRQIDDSISGCGLERLGHACTLAIRGRSQVVGSKSFGARK